MFYHKKAMIDLKSLVPSKKEKWLRAEAKEAKPIFPLKFNFLLRRPDKEEPPFIRRAREEFLSNKIALPFTGKLPLPSQSCLKKGGCPGDAEVLTGFSWLLLPALSYLYKGDGNLYKKTVSTLIGWIDKNPPLRGIGWKSERAVMTRAVVFPLLYDALKEEFSKDEKNLRKLAASILQHYLFIRQEVNPRGWLRVLRLPSLIFSGVFLRKFSMPAPDFDQFLEEFISFLHKETDKEGFYKGRSVEEHLSFFEASLYSTLLLAKNKYLIGEAWDKMEAAARILMEINSRDGLPYIGGKEGYYLLPLHLFTRNPEFLISLLCSFHQSSKVGTRPVEGVEVFVKPLAGSFEPRGFCSAEASFATLHHRNLKIILSHSPTSPDQAFSMVVMADGYQILSLVDKGDKEKSTGLWGEGEGMDFKLISCDRDSFRGKITSGATGAGELKIIREKGGFKVQIEVLEGKFLWNAVLFPGTSLSLVEDLVEMKREGTILRMELPPGCRREIDFIKSHGAPRLRVPIKGPSTFSLRFSV